METERLNLSHLDLSHDTFIFELVNTDEWIKYIGQKNIKSIEDAQDYIQKIIENPNVDYSIVTLKETHIPIGIITFIKRDYLEHKDIGFAFLPQYKKQGFAYEATKSVLSEKTKYPFSDKIVAIVMKENTNSIRLLEKLGLKFNKKIEVEDQVLQLYTQNFST